MCRVHIFNPDNDLALANGGISYTPPPAVTTFRRAGACLPLFYGDDGDMVMAQGIDARWYGMLRERMNIGVEVFGTYAAGMTAAPWGWWRPVRTVFEQRGFPAVVLPSDTVLDTYRAYSHRRTGAEIAHRLRECLHFEVAPVARECADMDTLAHAVRSFGTAVVKLPWSSSGRGVMRMDSDTLVRQQAQVAGMIRRQGSVMVEPYHKCLLDFAMLFDATDAGVVFRGYSVFNTSRLGAYAGNVLASDSELIHMITRYIDRAHLDDIAAALPGIIAGVAPLYRGPLGVDMMAIDSPDTPVDPVVEVNFRRTMGHVAHDIYRLHISAEASVGSLSISNATSHGVFEAETGSDGRIVSGRIDLAPAGSPMSIVLAL